MMRRMSMRMLWSIRMWTRCGTGYGWHCYLEYRTNMRIAWSLDLLPVVHGE
jgi:hypothetical protein